MGNPTTELTSRFASSKEVFNEDFVKINNEILKLNQDYGLPNQIEMNRERFTWYSPSQSNYDFYASRFWEFPFSILAGGLEDGFKCADVGCGTTPFTAYLCDKVGKKNVTAIDYNLIPEGEKEEHAAFGIKKSYVNKIGCNFIKSSINKIDAPDNSFDRVFCISVLEHIEDPQVKYKGIMELARILKPGGRLIITFDLGINSPFTHPLDVIKYSGLLLAGNLDLKWPEERFVHYGSEPIDVFGLVLVKGNNWIYSNHLNNEKINSFDAFNHLVNVSLYSQLKYSQVLVGKDYTNVFSAFKIFGKILLDRYH